MNCKKCNGLMVDDWLLEDDVRVEFRYCANCSRREFTPDTPPTCRYHGCNKPALQRSVMCKGHDDELKYRGEGTSAGRRGEWTLAKKEEARKRLRAIQQRLRRQRERQGATQE